MRRLLSSLSSLSLHSLVGWRRRSHYPLAQNCRSVLFAFFAPFDFFAPFTRRELDTPFALFTHFAFFGRLAPPLPLPGGTELPRRTLCLLCSLQLLCPLYSKGTRYAVCSLHSLCILWSVGAAAPFTRWHGIAAANSLPSLLPSASLSPLLSSPAFQNSRVASFRFEYWRLNQATDGLPPRSVSRTSYPALSSPMSTNKSGPFCHSGDCSPIFQSPRYSRFSAFLEFPRMTTPCASSTSEATRSPIGAPELGALVSMYRKRNFPGCT